MSERDDPFGRAGEEQTDPFGRPVESEQERADTTPRFLPPTEAAPPPRENPHVVPPSDAGPPARENPHVVPPSDAGPPAEEKPRFLPPTDAAPDKSAWWAEPAPPAPSGAPAYRAPGAAALAGEAADWLPRAGAACLDFVVRLGIVLAGALLGAIAFVGGETAGQVGVYAGLAIGALLSLAYAPWMIATRSGQTIGHRATDTRIVRTNGGPVSGGLAFVREVLVKGILFEGLLTWITFGIAALLNYLWALWDDRNETLHDKMCSTRVVKA